MSEVTGNTVPMSTLTLDQLHQEIDVTRPLLHGDEREIYDVAYDVAQELFCRLADAERERERLRELVDEIEMHCPCGARPESPHTHGHALSCPVAKMKELLAQTGTKERKPQ